jgi:hypothetical protein
MGLTLPGEVLWFSLIRNKSEVERIGVNWQEITLLGDFHLLAGKLVTTRARLAVMRQPPTRSFCPIWSSTDTWAPSPRIDRLPAELWQDVCQGWYPGDAPSLTTERVGLPRRHSVMFGGSHWEPIIDATILGSWVAHERNLKDKSPYESKASS